MSKVMNSDVVQRVLTEQGWTQAALAEKIGVSPQSVTNWIKGIDFPRPNRLLKLAMLLRLEFDELIERREEDVPVVAFRKRANTKTTRQHIAEAQGVGELLKPLVDFLPDVKALQTLISSPTTEYNNIQEIISQVRDRLGIGSRSVLDYHVLIGEFKASRGVLIPVLWGEKDRHENALHLLLKQNNLAFIFLNLDTHLEDFKFWMAHELAHVYTPGLAGSDKGEDFADEFAGALLFPYECAELVYAKVSKFSEKRIIRELVLQAKKYLISLNTVYQQVQRYAKAKGLSPLQIKEKTIHTIRNKVALPLMSETLFDPLPPKPSQYVTICENSFKSDFFKALERMIKEEGYGPSYVQQVLNIPSIDAMELHKELAS